jgi:hypothetical protein
MSILHTLHGGLRHERRYLAGNYGAQVLLRGPLANALISLVWCKKALAWLERCLKDTDP